MPHDHNAMYESVRQMRNEGGGGGRKLLMSYTDGHFVCKVYEFVMQSV